jgi:hypothetical protein
LHARISPNHIGVPLGRRVRSRGQDPRTRKYG